MINYSGKRFGHYFLIRLIGRGGLADVYEAEDIYLNRQVAIKVLDVSLEYNDLQKFLVEARIVASLDHPHIMKVLDFNIHGRIPYLVMNLAPNGSLRHWHPHGSILPLDIIVEYVWQIADALEYVHAQGIIHRDIKPENMLLGVNNEILLSDFGIATFARNRRSQEIQRLVGTIAYIAPERLRGFASSASDQYSLAVVVYEWLTGRYPFYGSTTQIAWHHMYTPPPPLRRYSPAISPAVEKVVLKALAKDPQDRFESVQAFTHALDKARVFTIYLLLDSLLRSLFSSTL